MATRRATTEELPKVTETHHQQALYQWWRLYARKHNLPQAAFVHVPNEGRRSKISGAILKSMGMQPGASDIFISVPSGMFHGLWIEMKTRGGRPTSEQLDFLRMQRELGYRAEVCYGWDEARHLIELYMVGATAAATGAQG